MEISLTLFLDVNFLLIILFPYSGMFAEKTNKDAESYGKAFCSASFFVIVYFLICYPSFNNSFFIQLKLSDVWYFLIGSISSLTLEFLITFLKYKKIRIAKIVSNKLEIVIFVLVGIPILEEVIYISCLYFLCKEMGIPACGFICLSAISFGLGHFRYPKINIVTKTVWGAVFAIVYVLTGNIYIVIVSHIVNNIVLYIAGKLKKI
jgi:membrane protease YdiL (CAAX protease family)